MATKIKLIADNAVTAAMIDTTATPTFGGITVNGDATVTGDLNITGNLNSYNVTDLDVTDQTITLGAGQTEALSGGSGIIVDGSNASILWDETNDVFDFNKGLDVLGGTSVSPSYSYPSRTVSNFERYGNVSIAIRTDSSSTSSVDFADENDADVGRIAYNHSDNTMRLFTLSSVNTDPALLIDSSSRVGIGTVTPTDRLQVIQNSGNDRSIIVAESTVAGSAEAGIAVRNTAGEGRFAIGGAEHVFIENATQGKDIKFLTYPTGGSAEFEAMRITHDGNVGIGIDAPTNALHVYHTATTGLIVERDNSGVSRISVKNSDGSGHIEIGAAEAVVLGNNTENKDIYFETTPTGGSSTERARIHANGGLSIGTSNIPASTTGALVLANGGAGGPSTTQPNGGLWIEDAGGTPRLTLYRASGDALRLDAQGRGNVIFDNSGSFGWAFEHSGSLLLAVNESNNGKTITYLPIEAGAANDHFKSGVFYNVGENPINNPWHTCTQVNSSGAGGGTANCGDCVDTTGTIAGCSQGTGSAYNWYSAKRYCELAGMRLCTRAEVRAGAGSGSGCQHNSRGQWTSTKGTTDSTKYFIVQGDGTGSSATAEQENYPYDTTITGFSINEIGIRCCQQNSWS